jgi:hypothetical protein
VYLSMYVQRGSLFSLSALNREDVVLTSGKHKPASSLLFSEHRNIKMKVTTSAAAAASCLLSVSGALALQTSPLLSTKSTICTPLLASSMSGGEENGDQQIDESKLSKYSQAIPFLGRPKALKGQYAGDVGFDPLGFAQNEAQLEQYREAEIKHARLAMLVSVEKTVQRLYTQ